MKLIENIRLRWRLWRVCRKLGIKPYKFQRQFALTGRCDWPTGRRNGKTMAVMLWGLIRDFPTLYMREVAMYDPDCGVVRSEVESLIRRSWFVREYARLQETVEEGRR